MRADAAAILVTSEFGEATTYVGTSTVAAVAIIRREPLEGSAQDRRRAPQRRAHYYVRVNVIPTPRRGLDTAKFPEEVGGAAVNWTVAEILGRDDAAVWHLLCVR
jgi:hypothetical protein